MWVYLWDLHKQFNGEYSHGDQRKILFKRIQISLNLDSLLVGAEEWIGLTRL